MGLTNTIHRDQHAYRSGMSTKTFNNVCFHSITEACESRRVQQLLQVEQLNAPQEKIAKGVLKDK